MKYRWAIELQLSLRPAKQQLRRRLRTLTLSQREREQIKVALCLNRRKQVRVALGLRPPRRQPNPRLQRRRMADVFLRRPQQSGLPEKKESISERYMGAVPRGAF